MTRFDRDTQLSEHERGRFRVRIDRGWFVTHGPNGGFIAALMLRGIQHAAGNDELIARTLTIHYLLPLVEGDTDCTLVHGTLDSPDLFDYVQTSWDAQLTFQKQETPFCFIGHSHVPVAFILEEAIRYSTDATIDLEPPTQGIINVGSVGQPRDGNPDSCFVIYDPEAQRSERYRVPYDIAATQAKILAAGLPEFLAERLSVGR